jgi:signal peptidase I
MNVLIPRDNPRPAIDPGVAPAAPRGWGKSIVAFLLSAVVPGLGQWRNREPRKGLLIALGLVVVAEVAFFTRILLVFWGMVISFGGLVAFRVWICADAFVVARRETPSENASVKRGTAFWVSGLLVVLCSVLTATDSFVNQFSYFGAFKVPSASFCPTICEGERIVADMAAFAHSTPKRGDVIMFDFQSAHGPKFIKRVVGIEGDVVSEKEGLILVNGTPFPNPSSSDICGNPPAAFSRGEAPKFSATAVPASSFFVVGDNSGNSYDSRIDGFGFVKINEVKGRPVYIYWSPHKSRIGCRIR